MGEARRLPWEIAGGPEVGSDVPITSEPRDEDSPGVPRPPAPAEEKQGPGNGGAPTEEREVRAADPELSPSTNERISQELRDVVGTERVEVPANRPRASRGEHPEQHGWTATLVQNRFQLLRSAAIVLTFAAVVSLATGTWWLLPLAAGVHALGTMAVTLSIIRVTTVSEHPSPQVAAAMAEEGVQNPDEHFSRMVEEFRSEPERGAREVLSPGFNERSVETSRDPANAAAEQSSAMSPTAGPSQPAGEGGTPDLVIWATAVSLLIVSVAISAATGGWMWLLSAVMVPLIAGWVVMQRLMARRDEKTHLTGRSPLAAIIVCTAVGVAAFCAVVAFAFHH
jgi:hypothetical protein